MHDLFTHPSFDDHEDVVFVSTAEAGLRGIIAIHDTTLGPAAGGCRMRAYASEEEALDDVLRLSRGMTMKNAAAGLPLGGGKCVVLADPARADKPALLRAMGAHVQRLGGNYWTAIDIGVSPADVDVMAESCEYVFTRPGDYEGDDAPARYTAYGGFQAVRAVAAHLRGAPELSGLRVAVQGAGQTGADLARQLLAAGAEVAIADVNDAAAQAVAADGATVVSPDAIHAQDVDVFAPCALGGILNDRTIPELRCRGIAGLANNQLERPEHGRALMERRIAYAPDFVANAGGIMRGAMPIFTKTDPARARRDVEGLYDKILAILKRSEAEGVPTEEIAERAAKERIAAAKAKAA